MMDSEQKNAIASGLYLLPAARASWTYQQKTVPNLAAKYLEDAAVELHERHKQ